MNVYLINIFNFFLHRVRAHRVLSFISLDFVFSTFVNLVPSTRFPFSRVFKITVIVEFKSTCVKRLPYMCNFVYRHGVTGAFDIDNSVVAFVDRMSVVACH